MLDVIGDGRVLDRRNFFFSFRPRCVGGKKQPMGVVPRENAVDEGTAVGAVADERGVKNL